MGMKELVFNVLLKYRSLLLVWSEVSRQEYHFLSTLVLCGSCEKCRGLFPKSKGSTYSSNSEIDR